MRNTKGNRPRPASRMQSQGGPNNAQGEYKMSLWGTQKEEIHFLEKRDENDLSRLAYHFIGGVKNHAGEAGAVTPIRR